MASGQQGKKVKLPELVASDPIKSLLRQYVACLICDEADLASMGANITVETFPKDMILERNAMQMIQACNAIGVPPSKEAITVMATGQATDLTGFDKLLESFDSGWNRHQFVAVSSAAIQKWYQEELGILAGAKLQQLMDAREIPYEERWKQAEELLHGVSPVTESVKIMTDSEIYQSGIESYDKNREMFLRTDYPEHAVWFLPSLRYNLSPLMPEEYTLFIAREGIGKSSFVQQQAEYTAWVQGGYDVLYLTLETSPLILAQRSITRNCFIPSDDFKHFAVDTSSDAFRKVYEPFLQKRKRAEEGKGYIRYARPDNPTPQVIAETIRKASMIAKSAGRKLLVILDLLERIEYPGMIGSNKADVIAQTVVKLANVSRSVGAHIIFVAQEGQEGQAFGATMVRKLGQLTLAIESDKYESGAPADVPYTSGNVRMLDYLGRERYLERRGNSHSSQVKLRVEKANNVSVSDWMIVAERPMGNRFMDTPATLDYISNMKKKARELNERQGRLGAGTAGSGGSNANNHPF